VVAGELTWYGGTCRRTHWWVEKDGQVVDPMGDDFLRSELQPAASKLTEIGHAGCNLAAVRAVGI